MNMRKEKRIEERNSVFIKSARDGNGLYPSLNINAYTYDLSIGGAKLLSERPFEVGTTIRIVFELAKTCQTVQVDGKVKWIRENDEDEVYEIGVELLHEISQTILSLIRHLYSKGTEIPSSVTALGVPSDLPPALALT